MAGSLLRGTFLLLAGEEALEVLGACPLCNDAIDRGVSNSCSTLLAPPSYLFHKNGANKLGNAVITFTLRNFPKSNVLVSTKSDTDLLFSPSELHLWFASV